MTVLLSCTLSTYASLFHSTPLAWLLAALLPTSVKHEQICAVRVPWLAQMEAHKLTSNSVLCRFELSPTIAGGITRLQALLGLPPAQFAACAQKLCLQNPCVYDSDQAELGHCTAHSSHGDTSQARPAYDCLQTCSTTYLLSMPVLPPAHCSALIAVQLLRHTHTHTCGLGDGCGEGDTGGEGDD